MTMTDHRKPTPPPDQATASTVDLVHQASEQISRLVRDEMRVAVAEMKTKGRQAGLGVGMLGGAGLVAVYGVAGLLASVVLLLALVMPAWLAALIVSVALFAVAGVMALLGRGEVRRVGAPVPEEAVAGIKADLQAVTEAAKERTSR